MAQALSFGAPAPVLAVLNGVPTTTSTYVAEYFGKQHNNVLRDIRALIALDADQLLNCEQVIRQVHRDDGSVVEYPEFRLTEEGFMLLAMGFTGKKALGYKLAFIAEFKRLRAALAQRPQPALEQTNDLMSAHGLASMIALHVEHSVFRQLLNGASRDTLQHGRWMCHIDHEGQPRATEIPAGAFVCTVRRLADNMSDPASAHKTEDLAYLAQACLTELERRAVRSRHLAGQNQTAGQSAHAAR